MLTSTPTVPDAVGPDDDRDGEPLTDEELTDEELAALALAASPDTVVPADAVPIRLGAGPTAALVADWYMPAAQARSGRRLSRRQRLVVLVVVLAFLFIDAYGLCSTYGWVGIA